MSLNISITPRRRNRRRFLLFLVIAVLTTGFMVAWQRGWAMADIWGDSEDSTASIVVEPVEPPPDHQPAAESAARTAPQVSSESAQPAAVVLSSSQIVTPESDAYTAELYASGEETVPWPNAGGRTQLESYTVQEGDTLWSIAARFELDIDTLRWSNPELERNPDVLPVGTELRIMPVLGVYHTVAAGEAVENIAAEYGVSVADITDYPPNGLFAPYRLQPGQEIIVPYGSKNAVLPPPAPAAEFPLAWPVAGIVTQKFHADHLALDIGAPYGSTIYAAEAGTVKYAGWLETGYGNSVIIDHGDGRETWYNHLKGTLLQAGGYVERGMPIAEVGSTGHSTGPHVHFELRVDGERVNPAEYLPSSPR